MEVTFLVALNVDELGSLQSLADQIDDDLMASGHDVLSVKPWARPISGANQPAGGFVSLNAPPPTSF